MIGVISQGLMKYDSLSGYIKIENFVQKSGMYEYLFSCDWLYQLLESGLVHKPCLLVYHS